MSMQNRRFVVGIVAGLLFALAIVASVSYVLSTTSRYSAASGTVVISYAVVSSTVSSTQTSANTSEVPPLYVSTSTETIASTTTAASQAALATSSTATASSTSTALGAATTTVVTSTVTAAQPLPPSNLGSLFGAISRSSGGKAVAQAALPSSSPSSISRILAQPAKSALVLVPVLVALLLGLGVYRASRPRE